MDKRISVVIIYLLIFFQELIAESTRFHPHYSSDAQRSHYLSLEANKPYYMEARVKEYGGNDWVEVGVDFFDVPVSAGVIDTVYNEEQQIRVASTVQPEIQVWCLIKVIFRDVYLRSSLYSP